MNNAYPQFNGSGTSIEDLRNQEILRQQQMEMARQHRQQDIPVWKSHKQPVMMDETEIAKLVHDIESSLPGSQHNVTVSEPTSFSTYTPPKIKRVKQEESNGKGWLKKVPSCLHEPLLIYVVYMVMSLDSVKNLVVKYVPQIGPDESGKVSFVGIVIYGAILTIVITIIKKLLL